MHMGHLIMARFAFEKLKLDELYFIPCGTSAYSWKKNLLKDSLRLEFLRRAIKDEEGFFVSDVEIKRKETSYTIETLRWFRKNIVNSEFFLLVGEDQLEYLNKWKESEKLRELSQICYFPRKKKGIAKKKEIHRYSGFLSIGVPQYEISSTWIRDNCKNVNKIRPFVHPNTHALVPRLP